MYSIIGGFIGFIFFLFELESPDMGNILFRINDIGNKELSLGSLFNMLSAPFKYISFWTNYELLSINWLITVTIGGIIGYILQP
jgi:hypothetical protein